MGLDQDHRVDSAGFDRRHRFRGDFLVLLLFASDEMDQRIVKFGHDGRFLRCA